MTIQEAIETVQDAFALFHQGVLEAVNAGDRTIPEVRGELKQLDAYEKYLVEALKKRGSTS